MKPFMDSDFLLQNETAKELYFQHAAGLPIIDYHCHISPEEIAKDRRFDNLTQVWLGGDHYKWRQMRSNGIEEALITGQASDYEKFEAWCSTLEKAIGNPLYHWSHLELKNYFGYTGHITSKNTREVWDFCNEKLASPEFSARKLIQKSNVDALCTTDDPADSLSWHEAIAADSSFSVKVLPAWRPDKAMSLEKEDYLSYLERLSEVSGIRIDSFAALKKALCSRLDFFSAHGCRLSDHGLPYVMYRPISEEETERIFSARLAGNMPTKEEYDGFCTSFLLFCGREYSRRGYVMQLHYGTRRDNNTKMFKKIGPDTGFDCINAINCSSSLTAFLNALDREDALPKTILYSLNPIDNAAIDTIIGCFQDSSAVGKLQHGSAWWFNDHKNGMTEQLTSLSALSLLPNFIGMLTDSRSFLSYTRHEYFRRILCNLIGTWVENGEYPYEPEFLGKVVEDISYYNAKHYFNI